MAARIISERAVTFACRVVPLWLVRTPRSRGCSNEARFHCEARDISQRESRISLLAPPRNRDRGDDEGRGRVGTGRSFTTARDDYPGNQDRSVLVVARRIMIDD